uniref:Gephyrin n=1 Tax=Phallusia mammillata TaxID=59560 RepID=A0A6F9DDA3_9ASCI|nr:gephyrin [Phallusia mammillata]
MESFRTMPLRPTRDPTSHYSPAFSVEDRPMQATSSAAFKLDEELFQITDQLDSFWLKTAKLNRGSVGTVPSPDMEDEPTIFVGILTVSDRCSSGENQDISGPRIQALIQSIPRFRVIVKVQKIVPDEVLVIQETLKDWSDKLGLSLILTTGGTGFSPRDVTPEATKAVIEKDAPAMAVAINIAALKITPHAMLSRAVCGIRGNVLIVNLPGSAKASTECLTVILPALPHGIDLLRNRRPSKTQDHQINDSTPSLSTDSFRHHIQEHPDRGSSLVTASDLNLEPEIEVDDAVSHACRHHSVVGSRPISRSIQSDSAVSGLDSSGISKIARRLRNSPYPLTSMDKAFSIVLNNSPPLRVVSKYYKEAFGHILAENVRSKGPLPPFPASIMDGYAVLASDTPGDLDVVGSSICERDNTSSSNTYLSPGKVYRITTGAPLPVGADAIVPVEETMLLEETDDGETELRVRIMKSVLPGQDVRPVGSDIKTGEVVVKAGTKIGPSEAGLLAAVGITSVRVHCLPVIALFSTGNELAEPDTQVLGPGEIRDSNRVTLTLFLEQQGYKVTDMGIIPDDPIRLKEALLNACDQADVIITSGGVSMGEKDFIKPLLTTLGATIQFGRVFMKPGKPTTFATLETTKGKKLFFALPGNPVSGLVTCNLFVLPCLRKMGGWEEPRPTIIKAKLSFDVRLDPRPEYQRVHLRWEPKESTPWADSTGRQISSRLLSMVSANGLLMLPPRNDMCQSIKRGEVVDAMVIDQL